MGKSLLGLLGGGDLDEDSWEEVEDTLVLADLGTASTAAVVQRLREEMAARSVRTTDQARAVLRDVLVEALRPGSTVRCGRCRIRIIRRSCWSSV